MEFKLLNPVLDPLDGQMFKIAQLTASVMSAATKKENKILEDALRYFAVPPIKGEITKGKVRWRGIQLFTKGTGESGKVERWLEQRGKRISPIITYHFNDISLFK